MGGTAGRVGSGREALGRVRFGYERQAGCSGGFGSGSGSGVGVGVLTGSGNGNRSGNGSGNGNPILSSSGSGFLSRSGGPRFRE